MWLHWIVILIAVVSFLVICVGACAMYYLWRDTKDALLLAEARGRHLERSLEAWKTGRFTVGEEELVAPVDWNRPSERAAWYPLMKFFLDRLEREGRLIGHQVDIVCVVGGKPEGLEATARLFLADGKEFTHTERWKDVPQAFSNMPIWKKYPTEMLGKRAVMKALVECFPVESREIRDFAVAQPWHTEEGE